MPRPGSALLAALALLTACDPQTQPAGEPAPAGPSREPLRHGSSMHDPWPLESVTGPLLFKDGCWLVPSGPNRIALYFPREATLADNRDIQLGHQRLREGQTYKFAGDLSETAVDKQPTCNDAPSSMAVGAVFPAGSNDR